MTNADVIDNGHRFVRFNTKGGKVAVIEADPAEWVVSPGDDLAVYPTDLPERLHSRTDVIKWRFALKSDARAFPYATHLNILFPALSLVDVPRVVSQVKDQWYNQTLCKVNDSVIRLGVMQGEYHWHKHDADDEFFFILDGHFIIDLEGRSIDLQPWHGYVVPKGVVHRTRAPERAAILMVSTAAIVPTGDASNAPRERVC